MARKLTEQERENVESLRDALTEALPATNRGIAPGIASALVRTPADTITEEDLKRIQEKYEEADDSVMRVVRETVLETAGEGTYTIRYPEPSAGTTPEASEASDMDAAPVPSGDASDEVDRPSEQPAGEEGTTEPAEQGESAPQEPATAPQDAPLEAEEPPAPKPAAKRRRGARRTHKSAKGAPSEQASEAQAPAGGAAQEHAAPQAERPAKSEKPDKPAKVTRREPAPSRDLKKVPYVRRGGDTEAEVRQRILELDQRFWMNGWLLSHPGAYTLYERELLAINDALSDGMLPGDITRRQLAYQMGGDEKFFEYGSDGFRLLRAMGMEDVIRHRPMPKPDLVYYAPRRRKHMRVLVTENLDPYLDVHDLMYEEGRTSILGQRIHAVVLGGGTPIVEKNRLALLLDTLGADTVTVLYWGDIDRAGLDIMVKLKDVLGDKYKFRAFAPAYQLMVDKARERFPDPADNEMTGQVNIDAPDASLLVKGLTEEAADYARAVIDGCGLIPQEILTRRDL